MGNIWLKFFLLKLLVSPQYEHCEIGMNRLALIAFLAAAASEGAVIDTKKLKNGTSFSSLFLVPSNHSRNKTSSAVRRHKSHDLASAIAHDNARRTTKTDEAWTTFIPDSNSTEGGQDDTKYLRCYFPGTIFAHIRSKCPIGWF